MINLSNRPDEPMPSGTPYSSIADREQCKRVLDLAELVYTDVMNASVHMHFLMEALESLGISLKDS